MKTRKALPSAGILAGFTVSVTHIIEHLTQFNLTDPALYDDINIGTGSSHEPFVRMNAYNKTSFFMEEGAPYLQGECYKQLYLTELRNEFRNHPIDDASGWSPKDRLRRLDRTDPLYNPIVDELNYTQRNQLVMGIFKTILDSFEDQVTRVRLA